MPLLLLSVELTLRNSSVLNQETIEPISMHMEDRFSGTLGHRRYFIEKTVMSDRLKWLDNFVSLTARHFSHPVYCLASHIEIPSETLNPNDFRLAP